MVTLALSAQCSKPHKHTDQSQSGLATPVERPRLGGGTPAQGGLGARRTIFKLGRHNSPKPPVPAGCVSDMNLYMAGLACVSLRAPSLPSRAFRADASFTGTCSERTNDNSGVLKSQLPKQASPFTKESPVEEATPLPIPQSPVRWVSTRAKTRALTAGATPHGAAAKTTGPWTAHRLGAPIDDDATAVCLPPSPPPPEMCECRLTEGYVSTEMECLAPVDEKEWLAFLELEEQGQEQEETSYNGPRPDLVVDHAILQPLHGTSSPDGSGQLCDQESLTLSALAAVEENPLAEFPTTDTGEPLPYLDLDALVEEVLSSP